MLAVYCVSRCTSAYDIDRSDGNIHFAIVMQYCVRSLVIRHASQLSLLDHNGRYMVIDFRLLVTNDSNYQCLNCVLTQPSSSE
jgi:hypothetical protein